MFSLLGRGKPPPQTQPQYVSIQLTVRVEIIARKFSMHFQCVPLIFTLARIVNSELRSVNFHGCVEGKFSRCVA